MCQLSRHSVLTNCQTQASMCSFTMQREKAAHVLPTLPPRLTTEAQRTIPPKRENGPHSHRKIEASWYHQNILPRKSRCGHFPQLSLISHPVFFLRSSEFKLVSLAFRRFTWRQAAQLRERPLRKSETATGTNPKSGNSKDLCSPLGGPESTF